jgi:hypothetical protein
MSEEEQKIADAVTEKLLEGDLYVLIDGVRIFKGDSIAVLSGKAKWYWYETKGVEVVAPTQLIKVTHVR